MMCTSLDVYSRPCNGNENQDAFMCPGDIDAMAEEDVEQYLFVNMV